ncbi:MAG TPA: hypothetical protein VGK40_09685 [Verrucomicrobiae bacterium]
MPSPRLLTASAAWQNALKSCADPGRVRSVLVQLAAAASSARLSRASPEQARILAALISGSQAMSALLVKHPEWLASALTTGHLAHPRQEQGLRREVNAWLRPALQARDYAAAFAHLRRFKQREMLRIAARDLARLGDTPQIVREISNVADVCLGAVLQLCRQQVTERFGQPYHQDAEGRWHPTEFAVLGLGKLGGQELNYSSDVDVMFLYSEEGHVFKEPPRTKTPPAQGLTSHQFFKRLAEAFIAEVSANTPDGALFRIDLRLRPEGEAGPLARALASFENYYAQWGQTWERMMLIKARGVAGDAGLAAEFLEVVQPFRYPRSLGEGARREIAAMKERVENEVVKAGEMERNVKLGRGGIREIEFVAQTLQLLHAGRIPFLQGAQTLPTLQKLTQYKLLSGADAQRLAEAYCFLRDVEHRVQMENNLQTHVIPSDATARQRLAALMGFKGAAAFEAARREYTGHVRRCYDRLLQAGRDETRPVLPRQFAGAEAEWKRRLAEHGFRDVEKAFRLLNEFAIGPGFVHVSARTTELAWQLLPKFFALCPKAAGPSPVAPAAGAPGKAAHANLLPLPARHEWGEGRGEGKSRKHVPPLPGPLLPRREEREKINRAGMAASLISMAAPHAPRPLSVLSDPDRVLTRIDSFISAYGARAMLYETWTNTPSLFELLLWLFDRSEFLAEIAIRTPDLVDDLMLSGRLRRSKTAAQILEELRHGQADGDQRLWLRRYHQAEFMRIGLRDILGLADFEQNLVELSALADACLQYALEVVLRRHKLKAPPFVIAGLGKLGGQELNYGSDLDILLVADSAAKNLPRLQKLATDLLDLLSGQTELGSAFVTDVRLRPDGEKGLLVNTLDGYEEYYRQRAQLWEIQAISRLRPIAGNLELGGRLQELFAVLCNFTPQNVAAGFRLLPDRSLSRTGTARPLEARPGRGAPATGSKASEVGASRSSRSGLAAYAAGWKQQIARMRQRIEKERTPPGQDGLAIKTGAGGLIDAEFIAQALCLEHGWQEPNTLRALRRGREERILPPALAEKLIENYRHLRRVEGILRRWSFEGETVLPDDPAAFYRVSVRCGFATPQKFNQRVAGYRKAIRAVYRKVFAGK